MFAPLLLNLSFLLFFPFTVFLLARKPFKNYAICLLEKGIYKGNQIIKPESIELLWTPRIKSPYGYGKDPKYCLGWVREEDFFNHTLIHHGGGLGVSTSFFAIIPADFPAISGLKFSNFVEQLTPCPDASLSAKALKDISIYEQVSSPFNPLDVLKYSFP